RTQVMIDRALPGTHLVLEPGLVHAMEFGVASFGQRRVGIADVSVGSAVFAWFELNADLRRHQARAHPGVRDTECFRLVVRTLPDGFAAIFFRREEDAVLLDDSGLRMDHAVFPLRD